MKIIIAVFIAVIISAFYPTSDKEQRDWSRLQNNIGNYFAGKFRPAEAETTKLISSAPQKTESPPETTSFVAPNTKNNQSIIGTALGDQRVPPQAETKTVLLEPGREETVFIPPNRMFWIKPPAEEAVLIKFFSGPLYLKVSGKSDDETASYFVYVGENPNSPSPEGPWERVPHLNTQTSGNATLRLPPWSEERMEVLFALLER